MDGVEFELRTSAPSGPNYPLSLDQRLLQGDHYREDLASFKANLQSIDDFYESQRSGTHTGEPDCEKCSARNRQIVQAYYGYYLSDEPDRWHSKLSRYRTDLQKMFNQPDLYSLEDIYDRSDRELHNHLKRDLCTIYPGDSDQDVTHKKVMADVFDQESSIGNILQFYLDTIFKMCLDPAVLDFMTALHDSTTAQERVPIYLKYYCSSLWSDSSQLRNFKSKYARMFEQGYSHDAVVAAMRKEAAESQTNEISSLNRRLGELKMAQSAHLKDKARKAEKDQRLQDRIGYLPKTVPCSVQNCEKGVNLGVPGGPIECALCDWLSQDFPTRNHFFYCSMEHAVEDFDEHDRTQHQCAMGNQCLYYPEPGPSNESYQSGICPDCSDYSNLATYFCSQKCYEANMASHRDQYHAGKACRRYPNSLFAFKPAPGMTIDRKLNGDDLGS